MAERKNGVKGADSIVKSYDQYPSNIDTEEDDYDSLPEIMNFFHCNKSLAQTIIQSSKMNGQINGIKKMCRDRNKNNEVEHRKGKNKHGW